MERSGLKEDIIETIKSDPILFGGVAKSLGITPMSLPRYLYSNDAKLTQADVLKTIREHMGAEQDSDLLTQIQEAEKTEA